MIFQLFLKHPHSIGETYVEHMSAALSFGATMVAAGIACMVHALIPAVFERTASDAVAALYARMTNRRRRAVSELDYAI
jgi:hypothetical protein